MKTLLKVIPLALFITGCSVKHERNLAYARYEDAVLSDKHTTGNITYRWLLVDGKKAALHASIPGKGKSGAYILDVVVNMQGVITNIKTRKHPGTFGPKVDAAIGKNIGNNLDNEVKIDAVSGATISTQNAKRILTRNKTKIIELLRQ